jgi:hypothetical protein
MTLSEEAAAAPGSDSHKARGAPVPRCVSRASRLPTFAGLESPSLSTSKAWLAAAAVAPYPQPAQPLPLPPGAPKLWIVIASSKSRIVFAAGTMSGRSGGLALRQSSTWPAKMRRSEAARFRSYTLLKPRCRWALLMVRSKGLHLRVWGGGQLWGRGRV